MAALDLDLSLAEYGQQETWRHLREVNGGEADFFVSIVLLMMDLV